MPGSGELWISLTHPDVNGSKVRARFYEGDGTVVNVGECHAHSIAFLTQQAKDAGFSIVSVGEHSPDEDICQAIPRAVKYKDTKLLLLIRCRVDAAAGSD